MKNTAIYVEWTGEEETETVMRLLRRAGVTVWEVDGDIDLEYIPGPEIKRAHTVFRIRGDRRIPVYTLLSTVAEHPSVYSVEEMA